VKTRSSEPHARPQTTRVDRRVRAMRGSNSYPEASTFGGEAQDRTGWRCGCIAAGVRALPMRGLTLDDGFQSVSLWRRRHQHRCSLGPLR
jgi:hypothetical protein